jgi:hypothetical protein
MSTEFILTLIGITALGLVVPLFLCQWYFFHKEEQEEKLRKNKTKKPKQ